MQQLGVNLGLNLVSFIWVFLDFLLKKSGLIFKSPVATLPPNPELTYAMWSIAYRVIPLFISLNPRSCNTSKNLS